MLHDIWSINSNKKFLTEEGERRTQIKVMLFSGQASSTNKVQSPRDPVLWHYDRCLEFQTSVTHLTWHFSCLKSSEHVVYIGNMTSWRSYSTWFLQYKTPPWNDSHYNTQPCQELGMLLIRFLVSKFSLWVWSPEPALEGNACRKLHLMRFNPLHAVVADGNRENIV